MALGLVANRLAKIARNPTVIAFASEVAVNAYSAAKLADSSLVSELSSKISTHGALVEEAADHANLVKAAKVIGVIGCAVALGKAVSSGLERAERGESLNPIEIASSVASRTVEDLSSALRVSVEDFRKGEIGAAALGAVEAALTVSSLPKDFAMGVAAEIGGQVIGTVGREAAANAMKTVSLRGGSVTTRVNPALVARHMMAAGMRAAMESSTNGLRNTKVTLAPSVVPINLPKGPSQGEGQMR